MKKIYLISGLGADERVFQNLNFTKYDAAFIKWIEPQKNEKIENYSKRLSEQIKTENPILIGLSFGGMIAIEIAKQIKTQGVILISSAKSKQEIPYYFRLGGKLGLDKLLPDRFIISANVFFLWLMGLSSEDEKELMRKMMHDTDLRLFRWSIRKIVTWTNMTKIENLRHIHGNADRILPIRFVNADKIVEGGGHLMVMDKAEEINIYINEIIGRFDDIGRL